MKIDSPTFLSETTFISASVQFSSGSQKFGDTLDDTHHFTGSVSINASGSTVLSVNNSSTHELFNITDEMSGSIFSANLTSGLPIIEAFSDGKVNIGPHYSPIQIDSSGNISGSSSSTGSFGRTVSGKFYASSNGAASNPEYSFTDDTDIGMYRHTTNALGFATNGIARLNINGNGQVAINDTNPADTLQIDHATGTGGNTLSVNANGVSGKGTLYVEGNSTFGGNISGSSTSTGSFGRGFIRNSLNLNNNAELRLGPEPYHAKLEYNNNGNLDITARSGFDVDIVHGDLILTEGGINVKADDMRVTGSIKSTGAIITDSLVRVDVLDGLWFNGGASSTFSPSPYIGYTSSPTGTGWFWQLPNNGTEKFSYKLGATEPSRQFRIVGPNWESSAIITGDGRLALGADKFELTDNPSSQLHISGSDSLSLVRVENSSDKLFEITGSQISGSYTSTGSFGQLFLGANEINAKGFSTAGGWGPALKFSTTNRFLYVNYNSTYSQAAGLSVYHSNQAANKPGIHVYNADIEAPAIVTDGANASISGSATSTGSFGSLVVADAIQGRTEIKGNFVPRGALNSGTNNVVIGDGAYSSGVSGVRNVVIGQNASGGGTMTDVDDSVIIGYRAGYKLIDGYYNVYIGPQAGYNNTTSNTNIGIGYNALYTDGSIYGNNVAIGHEALKNQSGSSSQMENTAIGASAGGAVTTGARQVFVGYAAGTATTTGAYNTMMGWRAGYSNTTGAYNTFLGNYAANSNLTGTQNVAIGNQAAYGGTKANKYIAIGYDALHYFGATALHEESVGIGYLAGKYATGSYNTFVGGQAGKGGTTSAPYSSGQNNVAVGYQALKGFTTGHDNTVMGYQAAYSLTSADNNVIIGYQTGYSLTTARYNVLIGDQAGYSLSTSSDSNENVMIGNAAGRNADADTNAAHYNVYIGSGAGYYMDDGDSNVYIGREAGKGSGTGNNAIANILIGYQAGTAISTGDAETAVGYQAAYSLTTGNSNSSLGYRALYYNQVGTAAVAVGINAGYMFGRGGHSADGSIFMGSAAGYYATGSYNVFIGYESGKGSASSTPYSSGENNIGMGYRSLNSFTSGDHNIALGYSSGVALTSGDDNVLIGKNTAINLSTGTNNIAIGENALYLENSGTYQIAIGYRAGYKNRLSDTSYNTFIGNSAGRENTSGNDNTYIGNGAGYGVDAGHGDNNTAVGKYAIFHILGDNTTAIGNEAGYYASGSSNTFVGSEAGKGGTSSAPYSSGQRNTAIGYSAMGAFTTGNNNVVIGYEAGDDMTSAGGSVLIGYEAGSKLTTSGEGVFIGEYAGQNSTNGTNVLIGARAGRGNVANPIGLYCIAIGYMAMQTPVGNSNIAIGYQAMRDTDAGSNSDASQNNIAIGFQSMGGTWADTQSNYNVAIGDYTMDGALDGASDNTVLGYQALSSITTEDANVAVGNQAMFQGGGSQNIAIGDKAMYQGPTGGTNYAIGRYSMMDCNAGSNALSSNSNIAIGHSALGGTWADADSNRNIAIGHYTMDAGVDGALDNVAVGHYALSSITSGDYNTALGSNAGLSLTTGADNVVIGYLAGDTMTATGNTVLVGKGAGTAINSTDANYTIAVGFNALGNLTNGTGNIAIGGLTQTGITTGDNNIAIGYQAMTDFDAGVNSANSSNNIAIGRSAMGGTVANTACNDNIAIGANTMAAALDGALYNIAIGVTSLNDLTTGDKNVSIGNNALQKLTTGEGNVAIGYDAGGDGGSAALTGDGNTLIGSGAALNLEGDADENTIIGYGAGDLQTSSDGNTLVGAHAGNTITTGGSNVCIGAEADTSANSAQNQIVIGVGLTAAGDNDFAFGKSGNVVHNDFDADAAWSRTSDVRKKRNIKDDTLGLEFINKLRPVTHQWKPSNEFPKEWDEYSEENTMNLDVVIHNMIAQDVKQALDEVGCDTFGGWKERKDGSQTISREMFVTPLIKAVQELTEKNERLENKINDLEIFIMDKLGDK